MFMHMNAQHPLMDARKTKHHREASDVSANDQYLYAKGLLAKQKMLSIVDNSSRNIGSISKLKGPFTCAIFVTVKSP